MSFAHTKRATLLAFLSTSMLVTAPAFAQAAEEEAGNDEIIVTAQKRSESLQKVPLSIQAINTEKLDQLQVSDFQDYVKFLPSVSFQSGGPGFAKVYFRGAASGENANHSTSQPSVGIYLDEQPITTIQGALDVHIYDIARVEALAGPQGTLYGASSEAGTIRIITNKPDTSSFYGAADAEVNSIARGDFGYTLESFINAPLSDTAAVRAVGWYVRDGGYIDNIAGSRRYPTSRIVHNNAAFVEKNYNDVETYGGRIALGIDLNDSWTITPSIMAQSQTANGSFQQESGLPKKLQTQQFNPEGSKDRWAQAALTIQGAVGNWDVTYAGSYLKRKVNTQSDYSDYAYFYDAISDYGRFFYDNSGALVSPNQYINGIDRFTKQSHEFRVTSPSDKRLRVIAGLFYQRQSHNIEQNYVIDNIADVITVTGTASNIWLTKQLRVDRDYAAFGDVTFDVTDRFKLTGGLRVYRYKNSLQGFFGYAAGYSGDKFDPVTGAFIRDGTGEAGCNGRPAIVAGSPCTNVNKTTTDTDYTHKLNATYEIDDNKLIYATWSSGFRPGGINRRGTLPPYFPDTLENYELGWKTTWADRAFRWNGAIYQLNWSDIQLSFLGANGLSEVRNAGDARIRGIEMDVGYRNGGFSLNLGGSYNKAKITTPFCKIANPAFNCALPGPAGEANALLAPAGTRLPVTPRFKGNFVARYEFPVGKWDAHVQASANYEGLRTSDLRTATRAIVGSFGAYTTADLSFGVKNEKWSAELFATNLFDSNGVTGRGLQCNESICGDPGGATASGGKFYSSIAQPRTIGLKVGTKF